MPSEGRIFAFFCSERDHKPQNSGCGYTTQSFHTAWAFSFREFTNLLNKGKRLPEIAKPEAPLDAMSFLQQLPVRGLRMKELSLLAREWRYSPATGSTGFASKSLGHVACPSCQPSPALRLAN